MRLESERKKSRRRVVGQEQSRTDFHFVNAAGFSFVQEQLLFLNMYTVFVLTIAIKVH